MDSAGESAPEVSDPAASGATLREEGAGRALATVDELPPQPRQLRSRALPRNYAMPERLRARIACGVILRRLHDITSGRVVAHPALLAVQVQAAKVLLAKALPDLQSVTISGDANAPLVVLTRLE